MARGDVGLRFLGAADTVTGSRYLVDAGSSRLLVDCGLFQGLKVLRERNRAPLPVAPDDIDAVAVTHAHLDHTGYLPALVRDGLAGWIHSTSGTAELCGILLPDSGHLLEEEAKWAQSGGWSRHHPPAPLYTAADAVACLPRFRSHPFDTVVPATQDHGVTFLPAGHILGAAQVAVDTTAGRVLFSGDLGRDDDAFMPPPRPPVDADVVVVESTYGDRLHPTTDPAEELRDIVVRTAARGGVVLLPAFAVGRTETLLLHLSRLMSAGRIPKLPVYVNSPMAVDVTAIYRAHRGEHLIDDEEFERMYSIANLVRTAEESKALNRRTGPMIIIAASGMITGGRILHHIVAFGSDPANTIVLTGHQGAGTRGAALARGERSLRIFGQDVPIRAEVAALTSLSAHADADGILRWLRQAPRPPRAVYVTHGEPTAADALRARIKHELGWPARVPEQGEVVAL